jgi:hypothetical protein
MSIFVDAARLIVNLGSFGKNFVGVSDPKFSGEYAWSSGTSMSADFLAGGASIATFVANRGNSFVKDILEAGSPILWAITVVEILEATTGFGPPHEGADLKDGSAQFAKVYEQVGLAFPDDNWQGLASKAYATQNKTLQDLAKKMQDLDGTLAGIVKDHAEWVTHIRLGFGILKDLLIVAFIIYLILLAVQPPAALPFANVVAGIGVGLAIGMIGVVVTSSTTQGLKSVAVLGHYGEVATAAGKLGTPGPPKTTAPVPAPEQSTVSRFEDIPSDMPEASKAHTGGGSSAHERPRLSAPTGAGETVGGGSAAAPATPATPGTPGTPGTPTGAMPTLSQLAPSFGQAAKLSGHVTPHATLVNQAMGRFQQIAQTAQQGEGAAAPAEEDALAGDLYGARVAVGAGAGERAPIHVAADRAEQAQEPSPAERWV